MKKKNIYKKKQKKQTLHKMLKLFVNTVVTAPNQHAGVE